MYDGMMLWDGQKRGSDTLSIVFFISRSDMMPRGYQANNQRLSGLNDQPAMFMVPANEIHTQYNVYYGITQ